MNKQKHLNLEARILIETMLNEHHSFKSIARELGKDCTTISKEIKAHICFEISVPCRSFASTAPTRITNRAGLAADVLPPASLTKNIFALSSPNLPMSVMAVSSVLGVLSKNVFTRHLMLRRNMNRSEGNPVLGLPFLKQNLSSSMMWYLLSSKKDSPFITLRYIMLTNL